MRRSKRMMEELEQDIRDHIERETQTTSSAGCRRRKRVTRRCANFGNVTRVKEETRECGV